MSNHMLLIWCSVVHIPWPLLLSSLIREFVKPGCIVGGGLVPKVAVSFFECCFLWSGHSILTSSVESTGSTQKLLSFNQPGLERWTSQAGTHHWAWGVWGRVQR